MDEINWDSLLAQTVDFTQRLVQTKSMPTEEAAIAKVVAAELNALNYDEVWQDEIGNVYGRIYGQNREAPSLVLNAHLDHVDPGDPALWSVPPYAGTIQDGHIIGRGTADIKGPLAVQVYSAAALLASGQRPQRDVVFTGVVEEEIGGTGVRHWADHLDYPVALVVLAEPTSNQLSLGHRGLLQIWLRFHGRSAHASVPDNAVNPSYAMARFLAELEQRKADFVPHPHLGKTTVSPTIMHVDTTSKNVTPAWSELMLDFRTAVESSRSIERFIRDIAGEASISMLQDIRLKRLPYDANDDVITGFYTEATHPAVVAAREAIVGGTGRIPQYTSYRFGTDGRHLTHLGFPIVGYSPADEDQAHIADEKISIDAMAEGLQGYVSLLRHF